MIGSHSGPRAQSAFRRRREPAGTTGHVSFVVGKYYRYCPVGYSRPDQPARGSAMFRRLVLLTAFTTISAQSVVAANATPPAPPVIVDCPLEPLQPDALAEIVAQRPVFARELTPASEAPATDDVAAATKIIEQSLACTNANQPLAAL